MNDKDKEAFEKWFKSNANSSFAVFLRENYPDVGIKWDREPARSAWQAACEYKQKEVDDILGQLKSCIFVYEEKVNRLIAENKKLRECVEYYADLDDECIGYDVRGVTTAREALKEVNEEL